jgi:ABC-type nitrate/sulfonate/bicarbonate transport system permease component
MRWLRRFGEPFLVVVVILAIFEVLVRSGVIDSHALPAPTTIVASFFDDIQHGAVWSALGGTLLAWVVGMLGVIVIGVPLGMLLGLNRTVYSATQPTFEFIRTVPSIAALPLLILLFGISARLAELMVFVGAIWPVLIQAMYGVQDVDPAAKDLGRAYGLGRLRLFFQIVLPSSLPYVIIGLRFAAGRR